MAATKGKDKCWGHVNWAMTTGIKTNPQWYPGLTAKSSFADFQCELSRPTAFHGKKGGDCEGFTPCINKGKCKATTSVAAGGCKAATKGKDKCWGHVNWAISQPAMVPGTDCEELIRGVSMRACTADGFPWQEGRRLRRLHPMHQQRQMQGDHQCRGRWLHCHQGQGQVLGTRQLGHDDWHQDQPAMVPGTDCEQLIRGVSMLLIHGKKGGDASHPMHQQRQMCCC